MRTTIDWKLNKKNGVLLNITIENITETQAEEIKSFCGYAVSADYENSSLTLNTNKSDRNEIDIYIEKLNNSAKYETSEKKQTGNKRIVLLKNAISNNLNHGKSWICSGMNIDKNCLHPSWEGEEICYIY